MANTQGFPSTLELFASIGAYIPVVPAFVPPAPSDDDIPDAAAEQRVRDAHPEFGEIHSAIVAEVRKPNRNDARIAELSARRRIIEVTIAPMVEEAVQRARDARAAGVAATLAAQVAHERDHESAGKRAIGLHVYVGNLSDLDIKLTDLTGALSIAASDRALHDAGRRDAVTVPAGGSTILRFDDDDMPIVDDAEILSGVFDGAEVVGTLTARVNGQLCGATFTGQAHSGTTGPQGQEYSTPGIRCELRPQS